MSKTNRIKIDIQKEYSLWHSIVITRNMFHLIWSMAYEKFDNKIHNFEDYKKASKCCTALLNNLENFESLIAIMLKIEKVEE